MVKYFKTFGALSAGYFYKSLQDPIVTKTFQLMNYQPPGGPLGNYLATQPVNAGSAWISGFEASYLQHYTSLPGLFGGLGLSANYGYAASGTSGIPGRSDHPRASKMKSLQCRLHHGAAGIGRRYDQQRSRGHARQQWCIGQAHDRRRVYNDGVDFLAGQG